MNKLRPPGAADPKEFMSLCIRCARCIAVCPYNSIKRAGLAEGLEVGTPYVYADDRACYMCMLCTQVCPTGALDSKITEPEQTRMGIAKIDENTCLNHAYARDEAAGKTDGTALYCNTCYNVCPLQGKAIYLKDLVIPVITGECTGCGICTERCPTKPKSVNIIPESPAIDRSVKSPKDAYRDKLMKEKQSIESDKDFNFEYNFNVNNTVKEWE